MSIAQALIEKLALAPHPEGGWYRQTWVGPTLQGRATGTAILFLLAAGQRSHWHRVDADEVWLWHAGAPLILSVGMEKATDITLGPDVLAGKCHNGLCPRITGRPHLPRGNTRWYPAQFPPGLILQASPLPRPISICPVNAFGLTQFRNLDCFGAAFGSRSRRNPVRTAI